MGRNFLNRQKPHVRVVITIIVVTILWLINDLIIGTNLYIALFVKEISLKRRQNDSEDCLYEKMVVEIVYKRNTFK